MYEAYRTIVGKLEPKPGNPFLPCYYAYHGDWKNYAKARNDDIGKIEELCIRHGCYFHLDFARWCKDNMPVENNYIQSAVSAKLIMNNDLSYVRNDVYCIWFPELPSEETCQYLYEYYPQLKYQIARVCVMNDYVELFKQIDILPEEGLLSLAEDLSSDIYDYILSKSKTRGLWKVFSDSNGILMEPEEIFNYSKYSVEVVHTYDYFSTYCWKRAHDKEYVLDKGDLVSEDMKTNCFDFDPLGTSVISDAAVIEKIKNIEANLNQLSTFH